MIEELTHLSLFTGIGGLDLAAEWAGFKTIGQCEMADYPTKVLEKHWPEVERWRDIHELSANEFYRRTGVKPGQLTCISGGFPCQPHSVIGSRKAENDDRHLWPEFMRVTRELRPRWVIGENVNGVLSTIHESICTDLEEEGYKVRTFCVPAHAVGAHHERYRVFIVGISESQSGFQTNSEADAYRAKRQTRTDSLFKFGDCLPGTYWAVHKPPVCGMADGFPDWLGGYKQFKETMTCYGNAVVPQQAYPIFKTIAIIEQLN